MHQKSALRKSVWVLLRSHRKKPPHQFKVQTHEVAEHLKVSPDPFTNDSAQLWQSQRGLCLFESCAKLSVARLHMSPSCPVHSGRIRRKLEEEPQEAALLSDFHLPCCWDQFPLRTPWAKRSRTQLAAVCCPAGFLGGPAPPGVCSRWCPR